MRTLIKLSSLLLIAFAILNAAEVPQVVTLEPRKVKPGMIVHATGVALDKAKVSDAFLTDHRFDLQVKVLEQSPQSMTFRVPPFVKPGRHQLLLQTTGATPVLLEEPVYLIIEVEAQPEVAKAEATDREKGEKIASNGAR